MLALNCGGGHSQNSIDGSAGGQQSDVNAAGASASGGTSVRAGSTLSTSGASSTGGANNAGGAASNGGTSTLGGASSTGGSASKGGASGASSTGGAIGAGGLPAKGGTSASGGAYSTGGAAGKGTFGGASAANSIPVIVDQGPQNIGYVNGLFVTVTLCEPGTTTCQTLDHVLVDTGSTGLRVLESALTLSLPAIKNSAGVALGECTQFVSGTAWGPIIEADVRLGGEVAAAIPIQAIGDKTYPMPDTGACVSGQPITDLQSLLANGIIGLGIFQQDCGTLCTQTKTNPGVYFACTSNKAGACAMTTAPLDSQVRNPIIGFSVDNNGSIIQLPSVPESGLTSTAGTLVIGIGTQSNNGLGSATVVTPVHEFGNIGTTFPVGGTKYTGIIDSGTNMYTFLDSVVSGLPVCTSARFSSLYCPTITKNLSATIFGGNNSSLVVEFSVANASTLNSNAFVFSDLAQPMPGYPNANSNVPDFLWGLTFFYGRSVYTAIELQKTPGGQGPFVAL